LAEQRTVEGQDHVVSQSLDSKCATDNYWA